MPSNEKSSKRIKGEFHCSFSGCLYNGTGKSFSRKKFLDQHIAKVHAEKKYFCEKCGKGFGMDWWRKHHEKTCGIEWMCYDCGSKYTSRESLLTHARRTFHDLPDHVLANGKMKQRKASTEAKEIPMIVVIQPIIQNIKCDEKSLYSTGINPRPILPKLSQSDAHLTFSTSQNSINNPKENISATISPVNSELNMLSDNCCNLCGDISHNQVSINHYTNPVYKSFSGTQKSIATQTSCESMVLSELYFNKNNLKKMQISTSTQTPTDVEPLLKRRESRASQCSRRKSKSTIAVGIESTHTQTAESAVVKIKKKRSRRKSVAITTEPNMLMDQKSNMQQSLWPNFKDLIFQNVDAHNTQSFRNTMSTQTNYNGNKSLCDSQTITDKELFNFDWVKKDCESNICKSSFGCEMPDDIPQVDTLIALQEDMPCTSLPEFDLFSTSSDQNSNKLIESNDNFCVNSSEINLTNKVCPVFPEIANCPEEEIGFKIAHPVFSHIHTQTTANTELENMLANTETQTTDDFAFYDNLLEFSDIETQTPWEDFPDIDNPSLPPDQLSIEIQTDFSFFSSDLFDLWNGAPVQGMIDASSERLSVNIETQTQDKFTFPQLINSESQTFDIANTDIDGFCLNHY